jgi:hypothetical protein
MLLLNALFRRGGFAAHGLQTLPGAQGFFIMHGFLPAHGLHGLAAHGLAAQGFFPAHGFFIAHGFAAHGLAAQGLAAHGFFIAEGFFDIATCW